MVGQLSTLAATGPAAAAVKLGAGVVETATGAVAVVGQLGQSPAQMEANGSIKPGSAALVNNLVQNGKTIQQALTPNLFTGKDGVSSLTSYINNPVAQVAGAVVGLKIAQKALTSTGLITGKESGTVIAGLVMAASTVGIQNTVNLVSNAASAVTGAVNGAISNVVGAATGALNSVLGSASSLVSAGNFAGNLASTVTGGLSSIAGALGGMAKGAVAGIAGLLDSAKGVAGSAFAAITGAFPTLTAGVPQNIKDITEKAQAAAQAPASNLLSGAIGAVTGGLTGAISGAVGSVTSGITGTIAGVTGAASGLLKTATGITANLSTGLGALPGGASVVASVVNNAVGAINSVPGVSAVTGLIGKASSITAGISNLASVNPLASSGILSAATGAAGALTKGLDDLKSGKLSLASLASAGLPAGAAAQLNSAISSMSSGGAVPIKLPTVAINTNDRSELTSQVASLLGDAKIPAPNFTGEVSATAKTALEKITEARKAKSDKIDTLKEKLELQKKLADDAIAVQQTAKNSLPAGDPSLEELRQKAMVEVDKQIAIQNEIVAMLRA
jgi:hypothetical protein